MQLIITDRTVDLLAESIDLAIRITEAPPPGLAGRPLMPVRHLLCASPAYPAARGLPGSYTRPTAFYRPNCACGLTMWRRA